MIIEEICESLLEVFISMSTDLVKKDFMNSVEELFNKFSNEISELKDRIDKLERVNSEKDIEIKKLNEDIVCGNEKLKELKKETTNVRRQRDSVQKQYDESINVINSLKKDKQYNQLYYGAYLLIISLSCENVDKFTDILKKISSSTDTNLNDDKVIVSMCEVLLKKLNYENKLNLYSYLDNYGIENMNELLLRHIKELVKRNISNSCIENQQIVVKVKEEKIEGYIEYQLISKKKLVCAMDQCKLRLDRVALALYNDKKYEEIWEWIPTHAYVCEKCNRLYLIDEQAQKLKKVLRGKGFYKQVSYNSMKMSMREYNIKSNPNIYLKQLNKNNQTALIKGNKVNNSISNESEKSNEELRKCEIQIMQSVAPELLEMGYSTEMSSQVRWMLLNQFIIPKIGRERTTEMLFKLVCYDGRIKKSPMVASIWKSDFYKIEKSKSL